MSDLLNNLYPKMRVAEEPFFFLTTYAQKYDTPDLSPKTRLDAGVDLYFITQSASNPFSRLNSTLVVNRLTIVVHPTILVEITTLSSLSNFSP